MAIRGALAGACLSLVLAAACGGKIADDSVDSQDPSAARGGSPSSSNATSSSSTTSCSWSCSSTGSSTGRLSTTTVSTTAGGPAAPSPDVQQQLMMRWNVIAVGTNFTWTQFNEFPNPTFKGGDAVAYGDFAELLAWFFEQGDDFDYLKANQLFDLPLVYDFPSGQIGAETTLRQLTALLSSPTSSGDVPDSVRATLAGFLMLMN